MGKGVVVGLTRRTACQLYIEQCRKKNYRVTVTHHLMTGVALLSLVLSISVAIA